VTAARRLAVGSVITVLCAPLLHAQSAPRYREFQLGADLASVSALAGVPVSAAKTIHERPAVIQDQHWRPPYAPTGPAAPSPDPVQQIVFSFYNDQLFRLAVDYDHNRTEGMTDADMIAGISSIYGSTSKQPQRNPVGTSQVVNESGTRIGRWGDAEYSAELYREPYGSEFRLIVTSVRLEALARTAEAEALRMDARDAPRLEIARQKKEAEDTRAAQEKARAANKEAFRP